MTATNPLNSVKEWGDNWVTPVPKSQSNFNLRTKQQPFMRRGVQVPNITKLAGSIFSNLPAEQKQGNLTKYTILAETAKVLEQNSHKQKKVPDNDFFSTWYQVMKEHSIHLLKHV